LLSTLGYTSTCPPMYRMGQSAQPKRNCDAWSFGGRTHWTSEEAILEFSMPLLTLHAIRHWGFLLGRPFRINMEDVTVDKPGRDSSWDRAQRWTPYGLPYPDSSLPDTPIVNPVTTLSQYRILLCEIMTPLGHVLYVQLQIARASATTKACHTGMDRRKYRNMIYRASMQRQLKSFFNGRLIYPLHCKSTSTIRQFHIYHMCFCSSKIPMMPYSFIT
jgi:hypothetical protein